MSGRPKTLQPSRSFTRLDPAPSPLSRSRASTLQGSFNTSEVIDPLKANMVHEVDETGNADVFAKGEDDETTNAELGAPGTFEELPIEIRSLTERFLESLTARVHPTPLSAEALSDLFQDFYYRAATKINTHIATLSARLTSDAYVAQSKKGSASSSRASSIRKGVDASGEQQMLSATEMADRKKARKLLEAKRFALEEAVERAVCDKVYEKIWRHRSTDDEERDHKLRSRTAALSLVGIGLKELLMTGDEMTEEERQKTKEKEPEIREWLSAARQDILKMNDEQYPLGKVQHLTAAHKSIVEALSKIFPATSSADEILPTLIYALITLPPVYLNVVSDLKFIQRFRGSSRMDGETAYCLVNLEAAISFLETVDLSSLRSEEASLTKVDAHPQIAGSEITPMSLGLSQAPDLVQTPIDATHKIPPEPSSPTSAKANRRLSHLIAQQTNKIEAAGDAVRESIIESADQALGRINDTLDTSFKFFFGSIRKDPNSPIQTQPELPKTLEDARKLVNSPTRAERADDSFNISSSLQREEHTNIPPTLKTLEAKMSDIFAGRKSIRDRSVDSTRSGGSGSGRRGGFASAPINGTPKDGNTMTPLRTPSNDEKPLPVAPPTPSNSQSAVDTLRNVGSAFNPLNRFGNMSVLPRFGRAASNSTPVVNTLTFPSPTTEVPKPVASPPLDATSLTPSAEGVGDEKGARAIAALDMLRKTAPPVKRFVEAKDAGELKVKEVEELLKEYQRLAGAMRGAINY